MLVVKSVQPLPKLALGVPTIEIDHLETPSPLNPLGVKGAGEAGVIPGSAAIAAAIEDAEGFPIHAMPISPSELWTLRAQHAAPSAPSPIRPTEDHGRTTRSSGRI